MAGKLRLVCLSAESADICARLGVWDQVVGVTCYANQANLEPRPIIGGFGKAHLRKVEELRSDLIFTFSDVKAGIASELIRAGLTVLATNPRSLEQIFETIHLIARTVGRSEAGESLVAEFRKQLDSLRAEPALRVRVYFEEWPDPFICGIEWVSELIEWCGGTDVFRERRGAAAQMRIVTAEEIIDANPEIILASWCGKPVSISSIASRAGFDRVSAVRSGRVFALESEDLLQPGPALARGARQIAVILARHSQKPGEREN